MKELCPTRKEETWLRYPAHVESFEMQKIATRIEITNVSEALDDIASALNHNRKDSNQILQQ